MWGSLKRRAAAVGGSALVLLGSAQAAVPAAVTTALDDMGADGISVATVVLVAIVGVFAFKFMRKGL